MSHEDQTLQDIVDAALAGKRAPKNLHTNIAALHHLVSDGVLRIFMFSNNFRQIEILTGPHQGLKTAAMPGAGDPWKIIDDTGPYATHMRPKLIPRQHSCEIFGGYDDAEMSRKLHASEFKAKGGNTDDLTSTPPGSGQRPLACNHGERPQPAPG